MNRIHIPKSLLPDSFVCLADVVGEQAAWKLVEAYGGGKLYVPKRLGSGHPLVACVGREGARRLVDAFAGEILFVPSCRRLEKIARNLAIVRDRRRGMSTMDIGRKWNIDPRTVQMILAKHFA